MTKKLTRDAVKKNQGYISSGLDDLKEVKNKGRESNVVRMNFEVSEELRNAFKAKVAKHGKRVKDILATFMMEYIESDKKNK